MRLQIIRLVLSGLLVLVSLVISTSQATAEVTIIFKGGVGRARGDRAWIQGDQYCWETRGAETCVAKERIERVEGDTAVSPTLQGPADPAPASTTARVLKASLVRRSGGLRFVGEVENTDKITWQAATILLRFFEGEKFVGQDQIPLSPGILAPGEIGTFDHLVPERLRRYYAQSGDEWPRTYRREFVFLEKK